MNDGSLRRALETKRDGGEIGAGAWAEIVAAYVAGEIDDAPMAALAMACAIRGMGDGEIAALTEAMVASGDRIEFPAGRVVVDKHSSGGVGDTVSLVVVPLVAACGVPVAKLSGRALGHTGGTLDKLEAIPGVRTDLAPAAFVAQIERIGCAIAAQSDRLVPADRKLYALRDRTGSVPSIGLICASIVSKKIAGGAGAIVYDVKAGAGAFLRTPKAALDLADRLVALTRGFGRAASAVVTDMDEPLAALIGTGVEVVEARDFLHGDAPDDRFAQLTETIAREMARAGGIAEAEIGPRLRAAHESGRAYETFVALVEAQGGTRAALEALTFVAPPVDVRAERDGFVGAIDAVAIGEIARDLVATAGPLGGVRIVAHTGTALRRGDLLAQIYGALAPERVVAAFTIAESAPPVRPLVQAIVRDAAAAPASNGERA